MDGYPIRLMISDNLSRFRLTVFFRLLLVIPHAIWLFLWGIAVFVAVVINWFATLIVGRSLTGLHDFIGSYVRYATHVTAYLFLLADPFPGFTGEPGYPVDLEIDPPAAQRRWVTFFRLLLALPALMLSTVLTGGTGSGSGQSNYSGGVLQTVGFLGWFVSLVTGKMPRGMRDLGAYSVGYTAQTWSYLLLLTDRYPNSDPEAMRATEPLPDHPITMRVEDDLRRSRLTVFFRLLLTIPHFIWLFVWVIAALVAIVANWIVTLVAGQSPEALHRFLAAYVRYQVHVYAYLFLIANPFPGFTGERYDIDVDIAPRARQNRWITGFRAILGIPAFILSAAVGGPLWVAGFLAWFAALALGRMPLGLRNLGAYAIRYSAQTNGYAYVLTDRYPFSGTPAVASSSGSGEPPAAEPGV